MAAELKTQLKAVCKELNDMEYDTKLFFSTLLSEDIITLNEYDALEKVSTRAMTMIHLFHETLNYKGLDTVVRLYLVLEKKKDQEVVVNVFWKHLSLLPEFLAAVEEKRGHSGASSGTEPPNVLAVSDVSMNGHLNRKRVGQDIVPESDPIYQQIVKKMRMTKVQHKDSPIRFTGYNVLRIENIGNAKVWQKYEHRKKAVRDELEPYMGELNEKLLFHGTASLKYVVEHGFDERYTRIDGMFGAGIYFAEHSSKSDQYIFGGYREVCKAHKKHSCYECERQLLLCRVTLGRMAYKYEADKQGHAPPEHHSVMGTPSKEGLDYPEYVIYDGDQAYPEYVIHYKIVE